MAQDHRPYPWPVINPPRECAENDHRPGGLSNVCVLCGRRLPIQLAAYLRELPRP